MMDHREFQNDDGGQRLHGAPYNFRYPLDYDGKLHRVKSSSETLMTSYPSITVISAEEEVCEVGFVV